MLWQWWYVPLISGVVCAGVGRSSLEYQHYTEKPCGGGVT